MGREAQKEVAAVVGLCSFAASACGRQLARLKAFAPSSGHTSGGNALAVGRVEQHDARHLAGGHALQRVATAQLQGTGHTRALGVALGKVDHAVRHIAAKDRCSGGVFHGACFVFQALPHMRLEGHQFFKTKTALAARGNAAGDLGGLNGDGAAAAAGVVQRGGGVPTAGSNHGCSQSFLERRIAFVGTPATLEQRLAGGVDVQRDVLACQVSVDAHIGPGGFHAGALAALGSEAVGHSILDFERGKVQALERTVLRGDLDLEGLLGREPDFPGHIAGGFVQIGFAAVGGVRELHQHALRQSAVQVQAHGFAPAGVDHHAAAASHQVVPGQASEVVYLIGQKFFNPCGAGHE